MHTSKWMLYCILLAVLFTTGTAAAEEKPCTSGDAQTTPTPADNAFALNLYLQLSAAEGNLFFSPYSIRTALAMTYAGAKGRTADQMESALNFSISPRSSTVELVQTPRPSRKPTPGWPNWTGIDTPPR